MTPGIGIDVYGTLVDSHAMSAHLRPLVGDMANHLSQRWRAKQLEYTFRLVAMRQYVTFDVCTERALKFVLEEARITLEASDQYWLIEQHKKLPAFADAARGLKQLRGEGCTVYAFSNGVETTLRDLLQNAGLLDALDGTISVDPLRTFKPDPRVYEHLASSLKRSKSETWLVSSNPFDIIGAKLAGLHAAWIRRTDNSVFDPWDVEPDVVVHDLVDLAQQLPTRRGANANA